MAASLVLGVAGLGSGNVDTVLSIAVTLKIIGWCALVPFSFASLATGIVMSLGTRWGLIQHYWVLVKLSLNVAAIVVLLLYMQTLGVVADAAVADSVPGIGVNDLRDPSAVVHGSAALLLLLVALTLSVFKPAGVTPFRRP